MNKKKVVVIGAGVVGIVTAEALWNAGYQVTVFEQNGQAAMGTSAANAGQLCAPFCLPFGAPGFVSMFMKKSLQGLGVGARVGDIVRQLPWALAFMQNCSMAAYRKNAETMLTLAHESVGALESLLQRHSVDFGYRRNCGKLYLYDSAAAMHADTQLLDLRRQIGYDVHVLDRAACLDKEPALHAAGFDFAGGIYASDSSLGDCQSFTQRLAAILQQKGVSFHYDTPVQGVVQHNGSIHGVTVSGAQVDADIVVVTTAMGTQQILPAKVRSKYRIAPLKGYSLTLPLEGAAPAGSVTDAKRAVAISVLGNKLRITGGAYLSSSKAVSEKQMRRLLGVAKGWFPNAANYDIYADTGWAGFRPVTPQSAPFIGDTGVPGLYINTGHGGFGWTCAAASAQRVVKIIEG